MAKGRLGALLIVFVIAFGSIAPVASASKIEPGHKSANGLGASSLAFTGINTELIVVLGAGLFGAGVLLRRRLAPTARR